MHRPQLLCQELDWSVSGLFSGGPQSELVLGRSVKGPQSELVLGYRSVKGPQSELVLGRSVKGPQSELVLGMSGQGLQSGHYCRRNVTCGFTRARELVDAFELDEPT